MEVGQIDSIAVSGFGSGGRQVAKFERPVESAA